MAKTADATVLGVPRNMWGQFGIRSMPTLKAYNGKACANPGRSGNSAKQALDACGGGSSPTPTPPSPRPPPPPPPRPPSRPSGGGWTSNQNYMIMASRSNSVRSCPSQHGFRRSNSRTGPVCIRQAHSDLSNTAKQICAATADCKAITTGACRS